MFALGVLVVTNALFGPELTEDEWAYHHHYDKETVERLGCDHPIYCKGEFLHNVQMAEVFNDSKTFVDMPIRTSINEVLQDFSALKDKTSKAALKNLTEFHFLEAGAEIESHHPVDWVANPGILSKIVDTKLRDFAAALNDIWKELSKKYVFPASTSGKVEPNNFSSLSVLKHPFIVPGGRFREFYYWDTYWITEGLRLCDMNTTVENILQNLILIIEKYGFIPNGARVYYKNRSQPPMYVHMLHRYAVYSGYFEGKSTTNETLLINRGVRAAELEYEWWLASGSVVSVGDVSLNAYRLKNVTYPRPESYREDVATAASFLSRNDTVGAGKLYAEIAGAAESGWDFSSRWMSNSKDINNISSIRTSQVVPVDLNAIIYKNEVFLSDFLTAQQNTSGAEYYSIKAARRKNALKSVFFDDSVGVWADHNLTAHGRSKRSYLSDFVPLFVGIKPEGDSDKVVSAVRGFFEAGGLPTSKIASGQQWDAPNAWPPLQHMAIVGLQKLNTTASTVLAREISEEWVASNYCGWALGRGMFEKYNASQPGTHGSGGEYAVQFGFGWTNGVVLSLLDQYPDLTAPDCKKLMKAK